MLMYFGIAIAVVAAVVLVVAIIKGLSFGIGLIAVIALVVGAVLWYEAPSPVQSAKPAHHTTHKSAPIPKQAKTAADVTCPNSWKVVSVSHGGNRLFGNGINPDVVNQAALQFETNGVQYDPADMAILSNAETPAGQPTVTQKQLVTSDGQCFSALGVATYKNLQNFVTTAQAATTTLAPGSTAYNTAVVGGTGTQYADVLSGNLRAVKVVGANGTTFVILYRCGNIVTQTQTPGTPVIPTPPPTTQPPVIPPPSTQPPSTTTPTTQPCVVGTVVRDKCDNPEPTQGGGGSGGPGAGGSPANGPDNKNQNPPPSGCNPGGTCPTAPPPTPTSTTAPPTDWTVPLPTPEGGTTPPMPPTTVPNSTLPPVPPG